jgi:hypothetical protein
MKQTVKTTLLEEIQINPVSAVGRALVDIFNQQAAEEKSCNYTRLSNGMGFSKAHGRIGALAAKYFLKHGTLLDWQLKPWLKDKNGKPMICQYEKQIAKIRGPLDLSIGREALFNNMTSFDRNGNIV